MSTQLHGLRIRTIGILTSLITGLVAVPGPSTAHAQSTDEKAVIATVDRFFEGMLKADSMIMKSTIAAGARLTGVGDRNGTQTLSVTPMEQFITAVGSRPAGANEKIYNPEVRIDGDLATLWAFYTLHSGERFIHCGVDAFQLLRMGKDWKIVNVSDSRRTTNCDAPKMQDSPS
jgi:Putative lumazine-binding